MPITSDYHLHSSFSGDSDASMEHMILKGIQTGLTHMCFTQHQDFDYPEIPGEPPDKFLLNTDSYLYDFIRYKEKYAGQIKLFFGVELGLQPHLARENTIYVKNYDFDFIIGSSHVCERQDPYYPSFYEGRSEEEAYRTYFSSILDNIKKFSYYDVYGHLDYVVRYGPDMDREYSYDKYKDVLDPILESLIADGKGIEINTGGLKSGLRELHPCNAVIKRYRELGGEIITIGSDAHDPDHIAEAFPRAARILTEAGFRYYTVFEKRMPEFLKL